VCLNIDSRGKGGVNGRGLREMLKGIACLRKRRIRSAVDNVIIALRELGLEGWSDNWMEE
jgi:hypothetical protein